MQEEIFFAAEKGRAKTPGELAGFLCEHGVAVQACSTESGWRLVFEQAQGTYADLAIDGCGNVEAVFVRVGRLKDVEDFRRIRAGFEQLGWEYCDLSDNEAS